MRLPTGLKAILAMGTLICIISAAWAETYKYDVLGRLSSVQFEDGSTKVFTYDPAGNRSSTVSTNPNTVGGSMPCSEITEDPVTWIVEGRLCSSGEGYTPPINHGSTQTFSDYGRFTWRGSATYRCENGERVLVTATCG